MAIVRKEDEAWGKLAETSEEEREAKILERYTERATLPEESRLERLRPMAAAEYALPDEQLRKFSASRLRAWLKMDVEQARAIIHSYEAVMETMPGAAAMRRASMSQSAARDFSLEDLGRLRALSPLTGISALAAAVDMPNREREQVPAQRQKRGWAFWRGRSP